MNFGEVLSRAWQITWKYKVLWIFGLFAGLLANGNGSGSGYQFNYRFEGNSIFNGPNAIFPHIQWPVFVLLLFLSLVVVVLLILLSALGEAGLTRGAWLADSGENALTFSRLYEEGKRFFWRVLMLGIVQFAVGIGVVLVLAVPTILTLGIALLCLWPLFCLLVPLFLALGVLFKLAIIAITGENLSVMDGIIRAWNMIRAHPGQVIGMALILILGNLVISAIIGIPMLMILSPFLATLFINNGTYMSSGLLVSGILFVIYLPILLAIRSVVVTYLDTTWTVTFRRLSGLAAGTLLL